MSKTLVMHCEWLPCGMACKRTCSAARRNVLAIIGRGKPKSTSLHAPSCCEAEREDDNRVDPEAVAERHEEGLRTRCRR
eukprot:9307678-Pyramimonas_sp.AAC.1